MLNTTRIILLARLELHPVARALKILILRMLLDVARRVNI